MEYGIRLEDGEVVACDSCGCEVPTGVYEWESLHVKQEGERSHRMLCQFCACTMAGTCTRTKAYDDFHQIRAEVWKAAACVFNMLRHEEAKGE